MIEEAAQQLPDGEREAETGEEGEGGLENALFHDQLEDVARMGADGHADAEFLGAAGDGVGFHAVDADDGEEEGHTAEDGEERGTEAHDPELDVAGEEFRHRIQAQQRHGRVNALQRGAQRGHDAGAGDGRADVQVGGGLEGLGERHEDARAVMLLQRVMAVRGADADDLHLGRRAVGPGLRVADALAEGVVLGEEFLRQRLVDDGDARRFLVTHLAGGEVTAAEERDAHGLEVMIRRGSDQGVGPGFRGIGIGLALGRGLAGVDEARHVGRVAVGQLVAEGHGGDAGFGAEAVEGVQEGALGLGRRRVAEGVIELGNVLALRLEAQLGAAGGQRAAHKQGGAEEQHEREGNLRHDQQVAAGEEAVEAAVGVGVGALLLEGAHEVGLGGAQGRPHGEEHGGHEAEAEGGEEHGGARRRVDGEREVHRAEKGLQGIQQQVVAPKGDEQAERAAGEREQEALDDQLADDAAARGAEREADGDLARAGGAAGEEHVGEIEAGDEQDAARHAEQRGGERKAVAVTAGRRADAVAGRRLDLQFAF